MPEPHAATTTFFDLLRTHRFVKESDLEELGRLPEAAYGDVNALIGHARSRGWLTEYQAGEIEAGRGHQLAVAAYCIVGAVRVTPGWAVYKALHPSLIQPVALHVVTPEWLAPTDDVDRYIARHRSASLVQDPYIVPVLDAFVGPGGTAVVVEEWAEGVDLFHYVNEMGALSIPTACAYAWQVAQGLARLHATSLVHGSVSPFTTLLAPVGRAPDANGLLRYEARAGASARLIDTAREARRPPLGSMPFCASDKLGRIAFMPPERLTESGGEKASDVYGLGASLYYFLSGRPPIEGTTDLETLLHLQQGAPLPIAALRSDVPPPLADLVHQLLAREPIGRPSAAEAEARLAPFVEVPTDDVEAIAVPLATETDTRSRVPDAAPIAEATSASGSMSGVSAVIGHPEIEPLPDGSSDSQSRFTTSSDPFGQSTIDTEAPRPTPRRRPLSRRNKTWFAVGLALHCTAVAIALMCAGCLPNPFALRAPDTERVKPDAPKETGKKKRDRPQID